MPFQEDFDAFLATTDFGEVLTWNASDFNAIFDNEHYAVDNGESQVPVDVQQPIFLTKDDSIVGIAQGDQVLRNATATTYTVQSIMPDGTGMTRIRLSRT